MSPRLFNIRFNLSAFHISILGMSPDRKSTFGIAIDHLPLFTSACSGSFAT